MNIDTHIYRAAEELLDARTRDPYYYECICIYICININLHIYIKTQWYMHIYIEPQKYFSTHAFATHVTIKRM